MIGKIKDLIYDFNDILVALLILAVAAGVITWKLADIMAYPEYLAQQAGTIVASKPTEEPIDMSDVDLTIDDTVVDINTNIEDANSEAIGTETPTPAEEQPAAATTETKITIPSGSYASKIAQILFDAGLVSSTDDFLKELTAEKADTKLKAGTFTIPAGSTMEEIIAILIK